MMATTHAFAGAALATCVALVAPEFGAVALAGGLLGGLLPDIDLYRGHRRLLHFPTYYSIAAGGGLAIAVLVPTQLTVGIAVGLVAAAVHARMDRYGGGLELRPWKGTADRAVYDHAKGTWHPPKHWIQYDGSPGDLMLATAFALPALVVFDGAPRLVLIAGLLASVGYVAVRKQLPELAERLTAALPPWFQHHFRERFLS